METLNRFEGYMLNDHNECIKYVKAVNKPNVKVMLDTFHMNIEEDSLTEAIRDSGNLLGHFHIGEANRRCPYPQSRMNWTSIGNALREIGYNEYIVMEPLYEWVGRSATMFLSGEIYLTVRTTTSLMQMPPTL